MPAPQGKEAGLRERGHSRSLEAAGARPTCLAAPIRLQPIRPRGRITRENARMEGPTDQRAIIEAFRKWCDLPGRPGERMGELEHLASASPQAWCAAVLTLIPDDPTEDALEWLEYGLRAALATTSDRSAMEADLAAKAREDRLVASVVGSVLHFGSLGSGERHAIAVLGEELIFETWSRYWRNWRMDDNGEQPPDVTVDRWSDDLMGLLMHYDPAAGWDMFLRYLAFEGDPRLRTQSGIAWLETINFTHAAEFINRIEREARVNPRLREVLRGMYPPTSDPEIGRRFSLAMAEPKA
jgi:hypothetical protein